MKNGAIILKNWLRNFNPSKQTHPSLKSSQSFGFDRVLLGLVIAMVLFGLLMVYSASFIYAQEKIGDGFAFIRKQVLYASIGFVALWVAYQIPYQWWEQWAYPVVGFAFFLLILILIPGIGIRGGGARRWLHIGHWTFQPGEFAKFAVVFFVARQLARKTHRLHRVAAGVFAQFVVPFPILILLLIQPDFGSIVIISVVIFSMMFIAGVPLRYLVTALLVAIGIGCWLILSTEYRYARFITFLNPWQDPGGKGFQILQSLIGLHNGHWFGMGLGNGKGKLFYLPEAHNDFIFSVIGEELGFIGVVIVFLAYLCFIYRGLKIAWHCQQRHQNRFGIFLAIGITLILGLQGFINCAVVLGLIPTKGLTLPFISYGGSALVIDLFSVGILLRITRVSSALNGNRT